MKTLEQIYPGRFYLVLAINRTDYEALLAILRKAGESGKSLIECVNNGEIMSAYDMHMLRTKYELA